MKTCTFAGCDRPQFGGGFCRYHQYNRHRRGGDLYKPKKRIKKESNKRQKDRKRYIDEIRELWSESVSNKTNFCYFCGAYSEKMLCNHHMKGRTGDFYLDKDFFRWGHNDCHNDYHFMPREQLQKKDWYHTFLARLKSDFPDLYEKEIDKSRKSQPLNPKIWEDEDFE